jgi:type II secretory pathway component HofQ
VRQLNTTVVVRNGQTIVIGGMPADTVTKEGAAARGDLYHGHTFRNASDRTEKKQLFIFLTPTIFDQAGNRIYREEQKMRDWPKVPSKLPPDWK